MPMPLKDMTGERYGKLVVVSRVDDPRHGTRWLCKCDCGNDKIVVRRHLIRGMTKSCGCSKREFISDARTTHGMRKTRLYRIWTGVKDRCLNENSKYRKRYGGRGITICDEWKDSFEAFRDWALENGYS